MGKGDKRSRKGKVWRGSYGNTRPKKKGTKPAFIPKPKAKKPSAKIEAMLEEAPAIEGMEVTTEAVKPKKAAAKKPKAEGEAKKEPKKKAAPKDKKA